MAFLGALSFTSLSLRAETKPAETGQVTAKLETGYARLIFSFEHRPSHTVNSSTLSSGVFVLRFERPVDVNIKGLADALPSYVSNIRRDTDGQGLRFALERKIRVNTSEAGNQLYIDFLPEPWFGAVPPLPPEVVAELMREAQEKERLAKETAERSLRQANLGHVYVNSSEAPTFTRIEFVWPQKVPTSLQRSGDQLKVVFDRMGDIGLAQLQSHLPRFIEDISLQEIDLRSVVTMKVDPMRDVRMFQEGNAVYVDIQGPQRGALEFRADGQIAKSDVPDMTNADNGPKTKIYGATAETPAGQDEKKVDAPVSDSKTFAASAPATDTEPQTIDDLISKTENSNATAPVIAKVEAATAVKKDAAAAIVKPAPSTLASATAIKAADNPSLIVPETSAEGAGTRITFPFLTETPAAMFQRGETLWLVFATAQKIDPQPIKDIFERKLRRIDIDYTGKLAIVRITIDAPYLASALSLDTNWTVTLGDAISQTSEAAELKARVAPDGRNVVNGYMSRAVSIEKIRDPVVGDELTMVMAMGPAIGMVKPQQFIDFSSLATVHGAAMIANADDLTFRLDDIGFVVERSGSLAVSVGPKQSAQLSSQPAQASFGAVDFEGWKLGPQEEFSKIKAELIDRAAMSEGAMRNAARLDLARFYLAYEDGQEALSLLNLVAQDDPAAERELGFRVMRGVANVQANHFDNAQRDLSDALLDENPDVSIWRGLAAAQKNDWKLARSNLEKAQIVMVNYPRSLQSTVLLTLARATIELNDLVNTDAVLDEASNTLSSAEDRVELNLLRGRFNEAVGRNDAAIDFYKQIDQIQHTQSGSEATLRMVTLQEKLGEITQTQAIKALGQLAFSWRGDTLELQTYQRLGALYVKADQFREAFGAMRSATLADPNSEISRQLYDDMRVVFTSLYLDGKADKLQTVEALSLFYDFRELTPAGRLGDEIIRSLAGRLVEVDLLDQAIDLLSYQVKNRLSGIARTEVGTELALIHLMNKEPQKALSVLHTTRQTTMPADLEKKRNLIEARSLAGTGRPELATELLSADTEDNLRLRSDILWESKNWKLSGETTEKLLNDRWQKNVVLSEQERSDIMRAAVAFAMAGDADSVQRFRNKYLAAMAETTEAHLFDVATGPIENQGSEFRTLARNLAAVDNLQGFWKTYREEYGRSVKKEPQAKLDAAPPLPRDKKKAA